MHQKQISCIYSEKGGRLCLTRRHNLTIAACCAAGLKCPSVTVDGYADPGHRRNHDWLTIPREKPVITGLCGLGVSRMVFRKRRPHMDSTTKDNVDYRLLNRLSNIVICSPCLRRGKVTPVPQIISDRHSLSNECPSCRRGKAGRKGYRRTLGKLLNLAL
jgi:hypothetical protein